MNTKQIPKHLTLVCLVLILLSVSTITFGKNTIPSPNWQVCFSPKGGCTEAIIKQLNSAKSSIFVMAYYLTSQPVADALVTAKRHGVSVNVIVDTSQLKAKSSLAQLISKAGISVSVDKAHAIMHNKVIVIDGNTVLTGSFNFTKSAEERNAENILIIKDNELAEKYLENWWVHRGHSGRV